MRITGQGVNNYTQFYKPNWSVKRDDNNRPVTNRPDNDRQNASFRIKSLVENLIEKKERLQEQIGIIIAEESIHPAKAQSRVKDLQNQIEELNKFIEEAKFEEFKKTADIINADNHDLTSNIEQDDVNSSIIITSTSISQAKTISGLGRKIEGEAKVLKSEIKLDRLRGASEESLKDKTEKLAKIEEKVEAIYDQLGDKLKYLTEEIKISQKMAANDEIKSMSEDEYLKQLSEKFTNLKIAVGNYNQGDAERGRGNVTIAPGYLQKALNDPKIAAELENILTDISAAEKWFDDPSQTNGMKLIASGVMIYENGGIGSWSAFRPVDPAKENATISKKFDYQAIIDQFQDERKVAGENLETNEKVSMEYNKAAKIFEKNRQAVKIMNEMIKPIKKVESSKTKSFDVKL